MKTLIIALLCHAPLASFASDKINLAPKYDLSATAPEQSLLKSKLKYTLVDRARVRYKKFTGKAGALYVVDSQTLSNDTISAGRCHLQKGKEEEKEPFTVELVKGEAELSESDTKLYGSLIQNMVRDLCTQTTHAAATPPTLELGLSKKVPDASGMEKEYKVFNKNLGPNLNFGGEF